MKKWLFLGAALWALAGPARAQTGPPGLVVVRVLDYKTSATLYITRGAGQTEKLEFTTGLLGVDKSMAIVGEGYYQVFQRLYQEGYVLQNTFSAGHEAGSAVTMLFVKAK